jgi:iron complex outermembrane receptor protein
MTILAQMPHRSDGAPHRCRRWHDRAFVRALLLIAAGHVSGTSVAFAEESLNRSPRPRPSWRWFLSFCFAGAFACLIGEGRAQELNRASTNNPTELSLEELVNIQVDSVFGASKYEQKVTQAPASVSIVTADEIKKFGYRSLADVLQGMRGFYVSNDRNYSYLGSRGFQRPGDYNTRYLLLIDGHRMNENIYDLIYIGTDSALDINLVDRVEVIRGPSSSIYGNNAFLGVINVVTKRGGQINGAEGSVEGGSFDTYMGRFSFGKKFANDIEWLFSGSYYTSRGQASLYYPEFDQRISSDPRARNNGVARNSDGEESHKFFTSLSYHDFTLTGLYSSRTKDVPTASFGSFFGTGQENTTDERAFVELKYAHQFGENTEVLGHLSYDTSPYHGKYPFDYGTNNRPADVIIDNETAFGDWLTTGWQLKQRVWDRHTLIVGTEYRENLHQHLYNYDDQKMTFVDDRHTGRNFGVYAQVEAVLRTNLLLNAGLRYDYYSTFGGTLNPRVGLIYSPWEKTTFKLLYGQAFRAPSDYELYYNAPDFQLANNPKLRPETIQTYEAIYEQYLPAHLRFSASGYYYEINNLISSTLKPGTDSYFFDNVNRVQAKGMEFELEGRYPGGLVARASYALQRTDDAMTGEELSTSPRHLIKGNLIVPLYRDKVFAGLELQYQSSVKTLSGRRADDFVIANLTLFSKELVKGLEMSATVYNLLDTQYGFPASGSHLQDIIGQDGRSFRLKLTYKF